MVGVVIGVGYAKLCSGVDGCRRQEGGGERGGGGQGVSRLTTGVLWLVWHDRT